MILWIDFRGFVKTYHGILQIILKMIGVSKVSLKHNRTAVDADGVLKIESSFFILLLLLVYVAEAEPCVVMSLVCV